MDRSNCIRYAARWSLLALIFLQLGSRELHAQDPENLPIRYFAIAPVADPSIPLAKIIREALGGLDPSIRSSLRSDRLLLKVKADPRWSDEQLVAVLAHQRVTATVLPGGHPDPPVLETTGRAAEDSARYALALREWCGLHPEACKELMVRSRIPIVQEQ